MRINMIEELKKTPMAKTDNDVKNLFVQLDNLKKQIADAMVKKAAEKFEGKWVHVKSGSIHNYYHVKQLEEVNFSSYIMDGSDPDIYCVCDCEFSYTYLDGLRLYRQESTNSLKLGTKTKVCTDEEVRDELERFRKEMDGAVNYIRDNFTTKK